jgi:hypothetical protein
MKKWLFLAIILLLMVNYGMYQRLIKTEAEWKRSEGNVKAYASMFDIKDKQNRALQLTVDELKYSKDSVLQALNETRRQLKIKEKNIKAMQSISSTFQKTDTITFRDTIFKEPDLALDTTLKDKWYSVQVGLRFPSQVTVTPKFISDKHIIVSSKKETVKPPKRFFISRWLQKKHMVLHVDVVENNPYVVEKSSRYIEIVK